GTPEVVLKEPAAGGTMWGNAWVDGMQQRLPWDPEIWIQNEGRGLLIQGSREWADYKVSTEITPHLAKAVGLAARVQGMQRYYALLLCVDGTANLVKMLEGQAVLAKKDFKWEFGQSYPLSLEVNGTRIRAWCGEQFLFEAADTDRPLTSGAIAIVCEEGRGKNGPVTIRSVSQRRNHECCDSSGIDRCLKCIPKTFN